MCEGARDQRGRYDLTDIKLKKWNYIKLGHIIENREAIKKSEEMIITKGQSNSYLYEGNRSCD